MKRLVSTLLLAALLGLVSPVQAKVEILEFSSPERQERYNRLIQELRCLVCQNQNIADSNAELAKDLRSKTYSMVEAGRSESEIVDFMVARYGDFVMYRPPLRTNTALLWLGPFLILLGGLFFMLRTIKRRRAASATGNTVDETSLTQAGRLLNEQEEKDSK